MSKKKKRVLGAINTEGWMMSYADMATILLAMFIVLSTLGKDQTGVSLNKGMESWRTSIQSFGLGLFDSTGRGVDLGASSPHYALDQPDREEGKSPSTLDGEQEQFQHFTKELDKRFQVEKMPALEGQASFDVFESLNAKAPYLKEAHRKVLAPILPLLQQGDYRLLVVVWSPTPSDTAWTRTATQAAAIASEITSNLPAHSPGRGRVVAVGQSWSYVNYQRPVLSFVVAKTKKR